MDDIKLLFDYAGDIAIACSKINELVSKLSANSVIESEESDHIDRDLRSACDEIMRQIFSIAEMKLNHMRYSFPYVLDIPPTTTEDERSDHECN